MYAYVSFIDDKKKAIVPVSYIKNFNINSNYLKQKYQVLWEESGEHYIAQILLVEDTQEMLQNKISGSSSKRINVVPFNQLDTCESNESDFDEDETQLGIATSTQKTNTQKYYQEKSKVKAIREIMTKKAQDRNAERGLIYDTFEAELNHVENCTRPSKKTKEISSKSEELEAENKKLKMELEEAKKEVNKLRTQNDNLQQLVIDKVDELIQFNSTQDMEISSPRATPAGQQVGLLQSHDLPPTGAEVDGRTHLGYDVWLATDRMDHIEASSKRPSLFVRNLATELWGADTLKNRSVLGKSSPRTPDVAAKPPLTPRKLKAVLATYRQWLIKKGTSSSVLEKTVNEAFEHLGHKIADLNRKPITTEERRAKKQLAKNKTESSVQDSAATKV